MFERQTFVSFTNFLAKRNFFLKNKSKYYVTPCSNVILTGLTLTALIHTHLNAMIVVPFFSQLNKDRKQRKDRVCAEEGALRPDYCSGE